MSELLPIVVIPVYKNEITFEEQISLLNNTSILSEFHIALIKPQSLVLDLNLVNDNINSVISFEDIYFENIEGYNKLMRSNLFYSRFSDYTHILICQLDAIVFRNELLLWCSKSFDYIGAPWYEIELNQFKYLRKYLPIMHKYSRLKKFRSLFGNKQYLVGNGGLSLRNVKTHLHITAKYEHHISVFENEYQRWIKLGANSLYEDVFWTLIVPKWYKNYKIAPWTDAIRFSIETSVEKAVNFNQSGLPFGCHAWEKHGKAFWLDLMKMNDTLFYKLTKSSREC